MKSAVKPAAAKSAVKPVRHKKRSRKRFRPVVLLLRIAAWTAAVGVFWCAYLLWVINSYEVPKPIPKADAAIVLGASLWSDEPSPGLRERLEYAFNLYKHGNVQHLILTGGLDHNGSTLTEAEGMRNYLVEKGIPKERLVLENDARSTYENLLFSKPIAKKNGWDKLIIVTNDYHSPRSAEIADYLGYTNTAVLGFKSQVLSTARNQSREVLAFTKWKMDSLLLRIGLQMPDTPF
ncbi:YdcF family protein [Paenibacillus solisilvae]|uniref:YdcF family protein n=1 Tax=Paenibacillus solisilvae TaxID=2486751 RepID=A0ABW0VUF3_9BACL